MAVSTQSPAPYTAGTALLGVIKKFRDKGLAVPIDKDVLLRAGVSEGLIARTIQSLQVLDLIDAEGKPTKTLEEIRLVSQAQFQSTLAAWLKSAYAEVFQFTDPMHDNPTAVRDAFRAYTPHGQQDRMVALFLALCVEAGLAKETKKSESKAVIRKPATRPSVNPILRHKAAAQSRGAAQELAAKTQPLTGLHPAIAGMIQSIPSTGTGWTKEARDNFHKTFGSILDFAIPIVSESPRSVEDDE